MKRDAPTPDASSSSSATSEGAAAAAAAAVQQPQGEGKLLRASDQEVVHEGQFKDGKPATGWAHWLFG